MRPHEIVTSPVDGLGAAIDVSGKTGIRRAASVISAPKPMPKAPITAVKMGVSSSGGVAIKAAAPTVTTKTTSAPSLPSTVTRSGGVLVANTPTGPRPLTTPPPVEGASLPPEQVGLKTAQNAGSAVVAQKRQLDLVLREAKEAAREADRAEPKAPANAAILRARAVGLIEKAKLIGRGVLAAKGRFLRATVQVGGARAVASSRNQKDAMANAGKARSIMMKQAQVKVPKALQPTDRASVELASRGRLVASPRYNNAAVLRAAGIGALGGGTASEYVSRAAVDIEAAVREGAKNMGPALVSQSGLSGLSDISPSTVESWANTFTSLIQAGKQVETAFKTTKPVAQTPGVIVVQSPGGGLSTKTKMLIGGGVGAALTFGLAYVALRK